ncbi:hypothetical protein BH10BAC4_BH10BAC4_26190 [soil metagenome]
MRFTFVFIITLIFWPSYGQVKVVYKGALIETSAWTEAQSLLSDTTIVVIPLGAAAKEHGPHLQLNNDWLIAEYLKEQIHGNHRVIIYPTINYHYYPAFLEYAGSTSLRLETAYSMIVDICRVISTHGPKKIYILNTGVSTLVPLRLAKEMLAQQGILITFTDILNIAMEAEKKIKEQPAGTHADEIETSMMLYIAPETVMMSKAVRDIPEKDRPGPLTLNPNNKLGLYSPSGVYGDATLATREKGRLVIEAMVQGINREINDLRKAPLLKVPALQNPNLFTGRYALSKDEVIIVQLENDLLTVEGKVPRKFSLLPQGSNSFTIGERGRIVFFKDDQNTCSFVYLSWEGVDYLGKRIAP